MPCIGRVLDGTDMEDCNSPDVVRAGLCIRCLNHELERVSSQLALVRRKYVQLQLREQELTGHVEPVEGRSGIQQVFFGPAQYVRLREGGQEDLLAPGYENSGVFALRADGRVVALVQRDAEFLDATTLPFKEKEG